jgi:hypothetical protein
MRPSGLTWAIVTSDDLRSCLFHSSTGSCSAALLACPIGSIVGVKGRRDTRPAPRARRAATHQPEASFLLARSRDPRRARPNASQSPTRPPDSHTRNVAALAPPANRHTTATPQPPGRPRSTTNWPHSSCAWRERTTPGARFASKANYAASATESPPPPSAKSCAPTESRHRPTTTTPSAPSCAPKPKACSRSTSSPPSASRPCSPHRKPRE